MGKPKSFESVGWEARKLCVCGFGSKKSMVLGRIVLLLPFCISSVKDGKVDFVLCNWF